MMKGQPLWFLGATVGGWIAIRAAMLWPTTAPTPAVLFAPKGAASARASSRAIVLPPPAYGAAPAIVSPAPVVTSRPASPPPGPPPATAAPVQALTIPREGTGAIPLPLPRAPDDISPDPPAASPSRLTGSAWAIVRGGRAIPFASQLGGSQAGLRLVYALDRDRRLGIAGRFAGALRTRQQEAALGLDWRPTRLPVHLVAEQRFGIANARGGPALGLIGGIGPVPLTGAIHFDAYAQAGGILRDGVEGFADGAVRMSRPVAVLGTARLELGLAAWGGAQRGATRLDAGPAAALTLPVARQTLRVSLEWRQRIAGNAAPASGPALAIGTDF